MRRLKSTRWEAAKRMPPLRHSVMVQGPKFSIAQSEVAQWLVQQPEIMQLVFDAVKDRGYIVYDAGTGKWQGVDYAD